MENTCCVCSRPFRQYKCFHPSEYNGLKEMEIITAHAGCRKLTSSITDKKKELLDLEWKLYFKKNTL